MKPTVGIFGLSGCWGEQIVILDCEDELLKLVGAVDIVDFLGGSSRNDTECALAVACVEGSVSSAWEESTLRRIRERAELLIACGTCACHGGVAASPAVESRARLAEIVYGTPTPKYDELPHRPLSDFVQVDLMLPGCPVEKSEFLGAMSRLLNGDLPLALDYPVCMECKANGHECLLQTYGRLCAGPVTAAGCGARCPGYRVACIGCRGPVAEANQDSLREVLGALHHREDDIRRQLDLFAAPKSSASQAGGGR